MLVCAACTSSDRYSRRSTFLWDTPGAPNTPQLGITSAQTPEEPLHHPQPPARCFQTPLDACKPLLDASKPLQIPPKPS